MRKGFRKRIYKKKCLECRKWFLPSRAEQSRQRFCSRSCAQKTNGRKGAGVSGQRGKHRFKTGKLVNEDGYIRILVRDHPWPRNYHYMFEHIKVMEVHIGRRIRRTECVHHINGEKQDNRLENLQLMTKSAHSKLTRKNARVRNARA